MIYDCEGNVYKHGQIILQVQWVWVGMIIVWWTRKKGVTWAKTSSKFNWNPTKNLVSQIYLSYSLWLLSVYATLLPTSWVSSVGVLYFEAFMTRIISNKHWRNFYCCYLLHNETKTNPCYQNYRHDIRHIFLKQKYFFSKNSDFKNFPN